MFKTIKTWIYRIKNYEDQMHQLEMVHRSCKKYGEENNRQRDKIQEQKFDLEEANQKIYDTEQLLK